MSVIVVIPFNNIDDDPFAELKSRIEKHIYKVTMK